MTEAANEGQGDLAEVGHVTWLSHDEVAARQGEAGPWTVSCETCEKLAIAEGRGRDSIPAALVGYYATEAEAIEARVRHVEEAGERVNVMALRGAEWFAEGIADRLLLEFEEGEFRHGLVEAIVVDPLWAKFARAYQVDNELDNYAGSPDGALGRHLDAFIENAQALVAGTS